ncbi:MAG: hypothetical protein ACD_28C00197G0005 [uncultured bacterium]|nr:MAG: hypothetical protein ACD_28C00197G0005 [uncultured bacterium]
MERSDYHPPEQASPEDLVRLPKIFISPETCARIRIAYLPGQTFYGEPRNPDEVKSGVDIVCRNVFNSEGKRIAGSLTCRVQ